MTIGDLIPEDWIQANDRLPIEGVQVRMKWIDGETEWVGDIHKELTEVKPEYYYKLLWRELTW